MGGYPMNTYYGCGYGHKDNGDYAYMKVDYDGRGLSHFPSLAELTILMKFSSF